MPIVRTGRVTKYLMIDESTPEGLAKARTHIAAHRERLDLFHKGEVVARGLGRERVRGRPSVRPPGANGRPRGARCEKGRDPRRLPD
jgi:hypothetical protein